MIDRPHNLVPITRNARSAAEKFGAEHNRELLTILFTDLVDSTKLQSELGNVAARVPEPDLPTARIGTYVDEIIAPLHQLTTTESICFERRIEVVERRHAVAEPN